MNNNYKENIFDLGGIKNINITYIENNLLAIAEASSFGNNEYYFNRINVPKELRNKGIGTKLLKRLIKNIKNEKATLICDINPYGDLDFEKLKKWYMKHGFEENEDSQLILKNK